MAQKVGIVERWWAKVTRFEFWPFNFFYLPVFCYYAWQALRSRSFFFFTASNPTIEFGGMMGERKSDIMPLIPAEYCPVTKLFPADATQESVMAFLEEAHLSFPIIAKPDIGDRGWMVEKIHSPEELQQYLRKVPVDFLIQEFVDYPLELGIFYVRHPEETHGRITSIVRKGFLQVEGDGKHTVSELLMRDLRAVLLADFGSTKIGEVGDQIPSRGELVEIEAIGNHCRGTIFYDDSHLIDDQLTEVVDHLAKQIEGFYFGRFDLRCASMEDLRNGRQLKILELNGAGAEPGHIYQPGFSLLQAYRDVVWHLSMLRKVSVANRKRGHEYWNFSEGWKKLQDVRQYNRLRTP